MSSRVRYRDVDRKPIEITPLEVAKVPRLAVRSEEAASALGICANTLRVLVEQRGLPYVTVGRARLYPVDQLRRWLAEQATREGQQREDMQQCGE